jgi:FkbM family methyltransferase
MSSRDVLASLGLGAPYRLAVSAAAHLVAGVPPLERPFLRLAHRFWSTPGVGRLCRSIAYRFADRLRETGNPYRETSIAGVRVTADVTNWMFSGGYLAGTEYEPTTARYLLEHLKPGSVFVDIGANAGYFTLIGANQVGRSGRVFAFEPNPPVFQDLKRHVEINRLGDRVRLFDCALSNASANVRLFVSPRHSGFSSLVLDTAPGAGDYLSGATTVEVRARSFDDWLNEAGIDLVDLMKVDVEGAERQVVEGMAHALVAGRIRRLILETEWDGEVHRLILRHGYEPRLLESVGPVVNVAYECRS